MWIFKKHICLSWEQKNKAEEMREKEKIKKHISHKKNLSKENS